MEKRAVGFVDVLGVRVSQASLEEVLSTITSHMDTETALVIDYANTHTLNLAYKNVWLRNFLNSCLLFCDGVGVQLGARLLGTRISHRFTPPDWFLEFCQRCAAQGASLYLLGTKPGITARVAEKFCEEVPDLKVVGTHHGYFNKEPGSMENSEVLSAINLSDPDILVVGFGMPMQEKWIWENRGELNVRVFFAVGAMFDFLAGETNRGPRWLTDNGFEWLVRLLTEPGRLWKRYILGNPMFFWRVIKQRIGWR